MIDLDKFAQAVIEANSEIISYIEDGISDQDYEYSDIIGEGGDNSLNADLLFEDIFKTYLLNFATIYSEESGYIQNQDDNKYLIILDPLDGSDNFVSMIPYYGSSVALKYEDKTIFGAVCNFASKTICVRFDNELFLYDILNDKKSLLLDISKPKIGVFERSYTSYQVVELLQKEKLKFRSYGAIALSLSYARSVKFVLFLGDARDFDVEAGLFIVQDLYIEKNDKYLLVSKDKKIFDNLQDKLIQYS